MAKIIDRAAEALGVPGETLGQMKLSLTGESHVLIENHRGLLEYGEEQISVSGGRLCLKVRGEGLSLVAMDGCSLIIKGRILGIDLE